jgi:carboxymethylenebutenolidase
VTVSADDPAIAAEAVTFDHDGTTVFVYLARPSAVARVPGVIVVYENRGLVEHTKDVGRRLAKEGYVALRSISPPLTGTPTGTEIRRN